MYINKKIIDKLVICVIIIVSLYFSLTSKGSSIALGFLTYKVVIWINNLDKDNGK